MSSGATEGDGGSQSPGRVGLGPAVPERRRRRRVQSGGAGLENMSAKAILTARPGAFKFSDRVIDLEVEKFFWWIL